MPKSKKGSGELGKLAKSRRAEIPRKEKQYVIMKVFLVELEPSRNKIYCPWKTYLSVQMKQAGLDVEVITGPRRCTQDTTGAFLNFSGTNYWKSEQLKKISPCLLMVK